jgi:UDP-3-O-[3-hydroxymyristoyl] N-acetylglucosamine deacetylase
MRFALPETSSINASPLEVKTAKVKPSMTMKGYSSRQRTVEQTVSCSGIGLHSGEKVSFSLSPAPEEAGIVFASTQSRGILRPSPARVISTRLSTTIGNDALTVQTVEHLLSALSGLGIDNVLVTVDGEEIPIVDGSAAPFVTLLQQAGIVEQKRPRKVVRILRPILLEERDRFIRIYPSDAPSISYTIRFNHPAVAEQSYTYLPSEESFQRDIAPARTFGFLHEVERLRAEGLIRGGTIDNALVIGENGILNAQGLRFPDEFVRHKILDLIGDFSLLGHPICGRIEAHCSGHALHIRLLKELLAKPESWAVEEDRVGFPARQLALSA